jgi:hypothetical protein
MTSASAGTRLAAAVPVRTLPSRLAGFGRAKIGVKRNVLNAEADAADQHAAWIEGYLLRGRDGLDSATSRGWLLNLSCRTWLQKPLPRSLT